MDGVFMRKMIIFLLVFGELMYACGLIADMDALQNGLIRLHVVGSSDSESDQAVKLQVKDAVTAYLSQTMEEAIDVEQAKAQLAEMLPEIEALSNQVLSDNGFSERVSITLCQEAFPSRDYDTFSLPSGVYESLRIRIGEAEGKNWWCVVFPTLCLSATSEDLRNTAASSGFSQALTGTITGEEEYELRFFLLDCLGQLQNFFHGG